MKPSLCSLLFPAAVAVALCAPATPQASGFQDGELIYYSQAIPDMPTTQGAILRIDPGTGATSLLLDVWGANPRQDGIAYDPYRERLIFYGSLPATPNEYRLYSLDGFGNTAPLGGDQSNVHAIAPASGGRVYFVRETPPTTHGYDIAYLDAANQVQILMDATGTAPYKPVVAWGDAMLYDAGTNSLFVAVRRNAPWNCGTLNPNSQVIRIRLSADGTRVTGVTDCAPFVVSPTMGTSPVGLTHGPDGNLVATIFATDTIPLPRLQLVNPVTMAVSTFATTQHTGDAATNAGSWSTVLGRAVIVDAFTNVQRSFQPGSVGGGTIISTSMPISGNGSAEGIALLEIRPGGCDGTVGTYCQGKTTSDGCLPKIVTSGSPSASAPSGFVISGTQLIPQKPGLFFYGLSGPAANPFQGGTLCVAPIFVRTSVTTSTGAGLCGGTLSFDFNSYLANGGQPSIVAGSVVHGQFWFRDPAHPIAGSGLTNGVTFTVCP